MVDIPGPIDPKLPGEDLAKDIINAGGGLLGSAGHPASKQLLGTFLATAYGPPWDSMNGTGVTSQGTDLTGDKGKGRYLIAVDPNVIPYGTHVQIDPNPFGNPKIVFKADDTGGEINGRHIDIFDWRGRASQLRWGSRQVKVWKVEGAQEGSGIIGAGGSILGAASDTADFVGDLASTILNFRKLGELAAKAVAWFLRLIAKAIWDYVMAPVFHWNQRAVTYYWEEFFNRRNSRGGGFLVENAGVITLSFWSLGYGILWTSVEPTFKAAAPARETMLGRTVKSVEGAVARRNLVKPGKVKEKTPTKPPTKTSVIQIHHTKVFSANRRRPVRVEGRSVNDGGQQQRQRPIQTGSGEQRQSGRLILPDGVSRPKSQIPNQTQTHKTSAKTGRAGMDTQRASGSKPAPDARKVTK
jgi:3D (Asp-Asp-Asp) domain-containing protein